MAKKLNKNTEKLVEAINIAQDIMPQMVELHNQYLQAFNVITKALGDSVDISFWGIVEPLTDKSIPLPTTQIKIQLTPIEQSPSQNNGEHYEN